MNSISRRVVLLVVAGAALAAAGEPAADETWTSAGDAKVPLECLLRPDGTLDLPPEGIPGSIDPTGFRLVMGEGTAPRFVPQATAPASPAVAGDECWDDRFYPWGFDADITAVLWSGADLYVGGAFSTFETSIVNHVAKWDGTSWRPLGSGMNGDVLALAWDGTKLYAGGAFTTAGGVDAIFIAKWDGANWSPLGSGMNGYVQALAWNGSNLFAAGWFSSAGGVSAKCVARWDGTSWSSLGSGLNNLVYALAWDGSSLYAGGDFTTAGGVNARYVARWNGATWSPLGSGMNGNVFSLVWDGDNLHAGGSFTSAGGVSANHIAKWDGTSWSPLGSGISGFPDSLAWDGTNLYAGGSFTTAGGASAAHIAMWNGSSWSPLGSGTNDEVFGLAWDGTGLWAAGGFSTAGNMTAYNLSRWNGSSWTLPGLIGGGEGVSEGLGALIRAGGDTYAGGSFQTVGGVSANSVAKWSGTSWSPLGSGMNGHVFTLAWDGANLYAGGNFTTAGGVNVNRIARWDGTIWSPLGSGTNSWVYALAWDGSDLYAGGIFTTAGGVSANRIARWDGATWSSLGSGMDSWVYALAWGGTNLYAGGDFTTAGGVNASRIARWDGMSWNPLGSGVNGHVYALAWGGTDLYAGGDFTTAGGVNASRIARWDGMSWNPLGSGMNNTVGALAPDGNDLFAGGFFTNAGGISTNRIAKWNGTSWSPLGSGTNGHVSALARDGGGLWAGGVFGTAGGHTSSNISHWTCSCPDNPAVDITPNGPLTPCTGTGRLLTAGATGGTTPFRYQWTRDGVGIAGATSSTFLAVDTGTHVYNCRVRGTGCGIDVTDSSGVTLTWTSFAPTFAGLASVTSPPNATCTLSLAWAPATTSCPGPITYNVHRSTNSGFIPSPANQVASGISGSSFDDLAGLASGTTHYYIVRAVDATTGASDQNLVERSGIPSGPPTIGTWTDDAGDTGAPKMSLTPPWFDSPTQGHDGPWVYKTGLYGNNLCAALTTPALRLATGAQLTFWSQYDIQNGFDKGEVQISTNGGSSWARLPITTYPGTSTTTAGGCGLPPGTYFTGKPGLEWASYSSDLGAWSGQTVRLRWVISSDAIVNGSGWWIDDVAITQVVVGAGACTPGPPNPKEASSNGGMRAAAAGKGAIQMTFDPACGATDHAVYWGTGPIAGALAWTNAACGLGTSGTAAFDPGDSAPGALVYFVPVGQNSTVEGSFGRDSALVERPESIGVGPCDRPQNLGGSCP